MEIDKVSGFPGPKSIIRTKTQKITVHGTLKPAPHYITATMAQEIKR